MENTRTHKRLYITAFLLLFLLLGILMLCSGNRAFSEKKQSEPYRVSVLLNERDKANWMVMRQGIEQAARDFHADVHYVPVKNGKGVQSKLILCEIASHAQAVLFSPVQINKELQKAIDLAKLKKIPIVTVGSEYKYLNGEIPCVSCNNEMLGWKLGNEMIRMGVTRKNIAVLQREMLTPEENQLQTGLIRALKQTQNHVEKWNFAQGPESFICREIEKKLQNVNVQVLVALDAELTQLAGEAKLATKKETKNNGVEIYGIGRNNEVVSLLERGIIRKIAVKNEFNIGYLALQTAVENIQHKKPSYNWKVETAIVGADEMYQPQNQRLLFPFAE